jgi:hypothetical protein
MPLSVLFSGFGVESDDPPIPKKGLRAKKKK